MGRKFDPAVKYGRWQPVRPAERKRHWVCLCECGNVREVHASNLVAGLTTSCGCAKRKHGRTRTPEHGAWLEMRQRCGNPDHHAYPRYGGRGITVCERWQGEDGFVNFFADMGPRPSPKLSVERRDNDQGYNPENCYWGTKREQARNTRQNHMLTFNGRTQCVTAWAEELGMKRVTITYRLRQGWSAEAALTTPVRPWGGRPSEGGEECVSPP